MKTLLRILALFVVLPFTVFSQPFQAMRVGMTKGTSSNELRVVWNAVPDVRYFFVWKTNGSVAAPWLYGSSAMRASSNGLCEFRFAPSVPRQYLYAKIAAFHDFTTGDVQAPWSVPIGPLSPTNLAIYPVDQWGNVIATNMPATNAPPGTNSPPATEQRVAMGTRLRPIVSDETSGSFGSAFESFYSDAPVYRSTALETNEWEDFITVPPGNSVALYLRSDDGAAVWVNGSEQHNTFGSGQNWDHPDRSFTFITCLSGGTSNWIKVKYSNTKRSGSGDTDGLTLFVVGDNPMHPRVLGETMLDWYASDSSDLFEYTLNAHARDNLPGAWTNLVWTVSSHLRIIETNDPLQRIILEATGSSTRPGEDWIEVRWVPRCGGTPRTNRLHVTVFTPASIVQVGAPAKTVQANYVTAIYTYRMLDQFGAPFLFPCYVSEDTFGVVPDGIFISQPTTNLRVAGAFQERIQCTRTTISFTRTHTLRAHRERDSTLGKWFGWIVWHFFEIPDDISPEIRSVPGS